MKEARKQEIPVVQDHDLDLEGSIGTRAREPSSGLGSQSYKRERQTPSLGDRRHGRWRLTIRPQGIVLVGRLSRRVVVLRKRPSLHLRKDIRWCSVVLVLVLWRLGIERYRSSHTREPGGI